MTFHRFTQFFRHYVRIYLCCRNICVTQHLLYRPQICAALQQMAGKRMPHDVGGHLVHIKPGKARQLFQQQRKMLTCQVLLLAVRCEQELCRRKIYRI